MEFPLKYGETRDWKAFAFSMMLRKMAAEWEVMITTARMRRQAEDIAEKEKEREIQN